MFSNSLYIYGGFDGQMLSDLLKYTPGNCHTLARMEACLNIRPGLKCVWDIQNGKCIPIGDLKAESSLVQEQDVYQFCPKESRSVLTHQLLMNGERCSELMNCHSCVSTSFGCTYCSSGICSKEKCRDLQLDDTSLRNYPITMLDKCQDNYVALQCAQALDCHSCDAYSQCTWDFEQSKCRYGNNKTSLDDSMSCGPPCSTITNCGNCTTSSCIWCQNEERCVDKNAYTASFPYGQCREWTASIEKCRAPLSGSRSQCEFYKTCAHCRDDPACGWCDDGSNTGLGKCLSGGARGPLEEMECTNKRWYFTHCPSCQCNGHSTCLDGRICSQPCANLTTG